jgi:hypothetical protein
MNRPIKIRKLKKADCEVDFFFISGGGVEVEHGTPLVAEIPARRQHIFYLFLFFLSRFVDPGGGALVTADPARCRECR